MAYDEVALQESQRSRGGRDLAQIDDLDVELAGEGAHQVILTHQTIVHEDFAQAASVGLLAHRGGLNLRLTHQAAGYEQRTELQASGRSLTATIDDVAYRGAEFLEAERLRHESGRPQAMRRLERGKVGPGREYDEGHAAQSWCIHQVKDLITTDLLEGEFSDEHVGWMGAQVAQGCFVGRPGFNLVGISEVSDELLT
jgi:hypothetical protein